MDKNSKPEASVTGTTPRTISVSQPVGIPASSIETLNENELDALLNKSFESILMEQNIDTMINEFFINLK
jgi:hypothetical protein